MIWTAADIISAVNGKTDGDTTWSADGISIDSRHVSSGDLFIALKGDRHDGHDHIEEAKQKGAVAALISRPVETDINTITVDNTMTACEMLAFAARQRHQGRRIAITGSVGKTGTRMLVAKVLASYGATHFSEGNLNNHIGAPLSLARMPASCDFGVFELGMNHAGELSPLSQLVAPDIAVITTISDSHIGHFEHLNDIAMAKAEIFDGLAHPDSHGIAMINTSDHFTPPLHQKAYDAGARKVLRFGLSDEAEYQLIKVTRHADGIKINANIRGEPISFSLGMMASHWAGAGLIALGIVDVLGLPLDPALSALASARDLPGRGERSQLIWRNKDASIGLTLIDDSYNASPLSMASAIENFGSDRVTGRRIAILGDMRELGHTAAEKHAALAHMVESSGISILITVGPLMEHLNHAISSPGVTAIHVKDVDAAIRLMGSVLDHNDAVLVKGSHGVGLTKLVNTLKSSSSASNGDSHAA
ncbi:MAG: UDP-N-acetylmuramoyl-tripeptide--D-alanyl-D-alanine ligase [Candidatus Puniceispirillales bacterium]